MNFIVGALVAIVAALLGTPPLLHWMRSASAQQTINVTAGEAQTIETAAQQYVNTYQTTLLASATSTTPVMISVPMLISTNFLPSGTASTTPYGQTWQVEVLQPTAGTLQAMLVTTGGAPLADLTAAKVVQQMGSYGGFYPQNTSGTYTANTIVGAGGGWTMPVGSWGVSKGSLVAYVNLNGNSSSYNYLYRNAVPGNPQLNTMNTPLIMAATATVGAACSTTGAIAQNGTGLLVTCQGGVWTSTGDGHWRTPVSTYTALPSTGNNNGDVRLTQDTDRAFAWNGSAWNPLAVDQNGSLSVPGTLNVSGTTNTVNLASTGTVAAYQGATAYAGFNNTGALWAANNQFQVTSTSGWGISPQFSSGWSMVTSVSGSLNASPGSALGSIHANDIYFRSVGTWFSTAYNTFSSEIASLQSSVSSAQSAASSAQSTANTAASNAAAAISAINTINNEISSLSGGSCSYNTNGYCILPDGMYLEWGSFYWSGSGSNIAESYPKPFPNAVYSITTTQPSPSGYGYPIQASLQSNSTFLWNTGASPSGSQAATIYFIAVGH